jgi:hypothetical protein
VAERDGGGTVEEPLEALDPRLLGRALRERVLRDAERRVEAREVAADAGELADREAAVVRDDQRRGALQLLLELRHDLGLACLQHGCVTSPPCASARQWRARARERSGDRPRATRAACAGLLPLGCRRSRATSAVVVVSS